MELCWQKLKDLFEFPAGFDEEVTKERAFFIMGNSFKYFRSRMRRNAKKELEMQRLMEAVRHEMKENNQHFLQELEEIMKNCPWAQDDDAVVGVISPDRVTIDAVTKTRYRAVELDHPEDEDMKTLGENLGCQVFFGSSATCPLARIPNPTMIWMMKTRKTCTNTGDQFKALSKFYQKLALDIHIMSLWTMKEADFCSAQQIQIGFLNLVVCNHGTLKYTSTIDELAKSFHLNKSRSILLSYNRVGDHHVLLDISVERTTVNDYDSRGSQLENIHPFIEALNKAYEKFKSRSKKHREVGRSRFQVVSVGSIQMQPAGNDLCGFYVMHYMCSLINAFSGSQTEVSSTPELTDLEIFGFQEDLSGFILDKVVNPKGVHHLL
ncbi:unnamed protein product [Miscanthus lutarioriparius]|uniref:Ubiquitin-like protease family profile domain-containing protein n=1 Tax=Miscanthus lutarioriparius TaxID=422564 RepID=A0A811QHP2_9POAL|nr:unnamed protein product [Miscanthus lutarioriparius]